MKKFLFLIIAVCATLTLEAQEMLRVKANMAVDCDPYTYDKIGDYYHTKITTWLDETTVAVWFWDENGQKRTYEDQVILYEKSYIPEEDLYEYEYKTDIAIYTVYYEGRDFKFMSVELTDKSHTSLLFNVE